MVSTVNAWPRLADNTPDAPAWMPRLTQAFSAQQGAEIQAAWQQVHSLAGAHIALELAAILSELLVDAKTIAAALYFPVVAEHALDSKTLDAETAQIVQGALAMHSIERVEQVTDAQQQDRLHKMLLVMINDVRVALVKLAERMWALRQADTLPQAQQKRLAQHITQFYAPLASRLGIGQLKWEMEDRALRIAQPETYQKISTHLNMRRVDREAYLTHFMAALSAQLTENHVAFEVSGRVKHIASIWRKLNAKNLHFDQLFDMHAVRILVRDIRTCYRVLSLVHSVWPALHSEYDDYIATPKPNGYQSIHTVVKGPEGKAIEVQIRTFSMHEASEMGVAAHWRYKEGGQYDTDMTARVAWLRSLLDWQHAVPNMIEDQYVYVFTPQQQVIALPFGSTPIDFAYHIHTQVGHACRGAKVNGKMVPLHTPLKTGQQIEIITGKERKPSLDWLQEAGKYVVSPRAKQKIEHWFRQLNRTEHLRVGKEMLHKALRHSGIKPQEIEAALPALQMKTLEHLHLAIAAGDIKVKTLLDHVHQGEKPTPQALPKEKSTAQLMIPSNQLDIQGINNVLFHLAKCCHPKFGDAVQGYITQGKGVSIHLTTCPMFLALQDKRPERMMEVHWQGLRS